MKKFNDMSKINYKMTREEEVSVNTEATPFVVNYVDEDKLPKRILFCCTKTFLGLSTCAFWTLAVVIVLLFIISMIILFGISTWYKPDVELTSINVNWQIMKVELGEIGESEVNYYLISLGKLPSDYTGEPTSLSLCITADHTEIEAYVRNEFPSLVSANVPKSNSFWSSNEWEDEQNELFYQSEEIPLCSQTPLTHLICNNNEIYITVIREAEKSDRDLIYSLEIFYDYCAGECDCPIESAPFIFTSLSYLLLFCIFVILASFFCALYCLSSCLEKRCRHKRVFLSS